MSDVKKRVLILDNINQFLRSYIVDPSLSKNGNPIGGLQGTLKSLQKLIRETNPDKIIICWDGPGGSTKRKQMNKNYKEGRSPIRLNWNIQNMTESQQNDNKIWQMTRLSEYYDEMPVIQLLLDSVEADDIIAAVCKLKSLEDWQKVIVSSDKDFIQLCNENTVLYRPIQNEVLNTKKIIEQYGIHPTNFALARAIVGDKSDNIEGIKGLGLKTVSKNLPFLSSYKDVNLEYLYEMLQRNLKDPTEIEEEMYTVTESFCKKIVENKELIQKNYNMMQLSSPSISFQGLQKIKNLVEDDELIWSKTNFMLMMIKDGFGNWTWDTLMQAFNKIMAEQAETTRRV